MNHDLRRTPLTNSTRFCLTTHGHSTAFAYQASVRMAQGPTRRMAFEEAVASWAGNRGLEPGDGAYFVEFTGGAASLRELGEGLAICGESKETVISTVARLAERGLITAIPKGKQWAHVPTVATAEMEVMTAEMALEECEQSGDDAPTECRIVAEPLRQALSRLVDARRYLASALAGDDA